MTDNKKAKQNPYAIVDKKITGEYDEGFKTTGYSIPKCNKYGKGFWRF
jgi:hypothetical protein